MNIPRLATSGHPCRVGEKVRFPGGRRRSITGVFTCREEIGDVSTTWWWSWCDDGSLLEQSPVGDFHYDAHDLLATSAEATRTLIGPNGALEQFETQVRAGQIPSLTVHRSGRTWRVAATGTVSTSFEGTAPNFGPWQALASGVGPDPVYFVLVDQDFPDRVALGLWTTGVAIAFGRRLKPPASARRTSAPAPLPVDTRSDHDGNSDHEGPGHDSSSDVPILKNPPT